VQLLKIGNHLDDEGVVAYAVRTAAKLAREPWMCTDCHGIGAGVEATTRGRRKSA
jgi:hypothetical protein